MNLEMHYFFETLQLENGSRQNSGARTKNIHIDPSYRSLNFFGKFLEHPVYEMFIDKKYEKFIPRDNFIFRCTTTESELILLVGYQLYKFNLLIEQMRIVSCEEINTLNTYFQNPNAALYASL